MLGVVGEAARDLSTAVVTTPAGSRLGVFQRVEAERTSTRPRGSSPQLPTARGAGSKRAPGGAHRRDEGTDGWLLTGEPPGALLEA